VGEQSLKAEAYLSEQLGAFLDVDYILLKPIAHRQDFLPSFPAAPGPPAETILKRNDRWCGTATRRMLKVVALVFIAMLEESAVEMIV
jgi:hypothetical protein